MGYFLILSLLGVCLVALGAFQGGWYFLAVWLGIIFMILGIAHRRRWVRVFGKRPDGSLALWTWAVFLPLHTLMRAIWYVSRLVDRQSAYVEVAPELVLGRRLLGHECSALLATKIDNYVDLTAEFHEPVAIRTSGAYVCVPILDGGVLDADSLANAIAKLRAGRTYIHCAQGYGRTALFAIALLLTQGRVSDIREGLKLLRAARPGMRLNRCQRGCLKHFAERFRKH